MLISLRKSQWDTTGEKMQQVGRLVIQKKVDVFQNCVSNCGSKAMWIYFSQKAKILNRIEIKIKF